MRDPNEIILKKIHNSFLTISIAIAILSTILAFFPYLQSGKCKGTEQGYVCDIIVIDTLETYVFMLIMSASFLIISIIVYVARKIIIKRAFIEINGKEPFQS